MSLRRRIVRLLRGKPPKPPARPFDSETAGVPRRTYDSHEQYLGHQAAKLGPRLDKVAEADRQYEAVVRERYAAERDWRGARVLCLGARLGGEVRAFAGLGALAVGIDVEPGPESRHVLHGDFHALQFADAVFDVAFCNAVDHVYDLPRFFAEVARVLASGGTLLLEICQDAPHEFEVLDVRDCRPIVAAAADAGLAAESDTPLENRAGFVNWQGRLLRLRKPGGTE